MDALRAHFEELGLAAVETFIASGNLYFEIAASGATTGATVRVAVGPSTSASEESDELAISDYTLALARQIEDHLGARLGYGVPTYLRTPAELCAVASVWPFAEPAPEVHTLSVLFFDAALPAEAAALLADFRTDIDEFRVVGREAYWLCRSDRTTDSPINWSKLNKAVRLPRYTVRNATTVRRMAERYAGRAGGGT